MRKILSMIAAAVIAAATLCTEPFGAARCADMPSVSARAAVLIAADTGQVVFEKNSKQKLPMASTTKIMTTLIALENGDLDVPFTVDSDAIRVEGSSMGLQEGDIVTMYDLCCGMLLPSGNDAANAAAVRISGSISEFAELMNERAAQLGLTRSFFVTPSGLEGTGHGSSAYDMAILAREALKNETFREICSSESIKVSFGNPPYERRLYNTNKLLSMYDGVFGVKTGFTDEAGRCLVSACERGGTELICVTLNDRNDWNDHKALYDYGFGKTAKLRADIPDILRCEVAGGERESVELALDGDAPEISAIDGQLPELRYTVISAPFAYAPVSIGDECAQLSICCGERELMRLPLYAREDCARKTAPRKKNKSIIRKIIDSIGKLKQHSAEPA